MGLGAYHFNSKKFNEEHQHVGNNGATAYPQIESHSYNGNTPYVALRYGSRMNRGFELSIGASYRQSSQIVTYYNQRNYVIPDSGFYYDRTDDKAIIKVVNHVMGLEFSPTFRFFNTKLILGLINIDFVLPSQHINYSETTDYRVITKHRSYLGANGYERSDSLLIPKVSYDFRSPISLKNNLYYSIYLGVEQEIPIKRYRYLMGVKGILSGFTTLSFVAYVGIRISKPYTWKE